MGRGHPGRAHDRRSGAGPAEEDVLTDPLVERLLRAVEPPFDDDAYAERGRAADAFVRAVAERLGDGRVERQPPEFIFAFFDVAVAAGPFAVAPVVDGGRDALEAVRDSGSEPSVLRVLLGLQHDGALLFWQRFADEDGWAERTAMDLTPRGDDEAATLAAVRDALQATGWVPLDHPVLDEPLPGRTAIHPAPDPPRVRDVLFGASAARID